jgi:hypothetical protein
VCVVCNDRLWNLHSARQEDKRHMTRAAEPCNCEFSPLYIPSHRQHTPTLSFFIKWNARKIGKKIHGILCTDIAFLLKKLLTCGC